jgi:signal transduction histidine kinase
LIARVQVVDLRVIDRVLAVLLAIGAVADASSQLHHRLDAPAIASLVVLTGSVAWRRRNPVLTTLLAVTALGAFQLASRYSGDGSFEAAAIALNFYTLGRHARGRESVLVSGAVFAYWLVGAAVVAYIPAGGSVGEVLSGWVVLGGLPFAVGGLLASRGRLARELEVSAARLQDEQELRARRAAAEERNRMARELHDVIAHNVSVMVIQTSAAREVARGDLDAAREALRAVERSGREALVELRRIVGVLRRSTDELAGSWAPGLSRLDALVGRACAAGLPVELRVEGQPQALSPGLDLVAYRVVQEALTNAIKHAGPASAQVRVSFGVRELELEIVDSGHGAVPERVDDGSGHGLIGMSERVELYGGELRAGQRRGAGFEVRARIPIDGVVSSPHVLAPPVDGDRVIVAAGAAFRWPWLDPLLAGVLLVGLELSVLASSHLRGPLVLNMIVVVGMALAAIWRRRSPLLFLILVGALITVLNARLTSVSSLPLAGIYVTLVPTYTVAAWEDRPRALVGLAIMICGAAASNLTGSHGTAGDFAGVAFSMSAAWAAGRAIRARHAMTSELKRRSGRLVAEREDRARLAVAGERSRIARELHAVVAHTVAAMVIQTEAARSLLDRDLAQADAAMSAIESTGRQTLAEMRRILGVLRHDHDASELEPQPGVDQIYPLIQRVRAASRSS